MRPMTIALVLLLCAAPGWAQEKSSSLGKPVFPMLEYVNLNQELGLQSELLRGFGARVDDARRGADAEAVAGLAVLLAFAEETAAKTGTTITAVRLLDEAVRIAEEQQNRNAAKTIVAASRRIPGGDAVARRMSDSMALFAEKRGEGGFVAYVKIVNNCDRVLDVYVDGVYVGYIFGGDTHVYSTGNGTTQTRVTDAFGNTVSEVFSLQPQDTFAWTIAP